MPLTNPHEREVAISDLGPDVVADAGFLGAIMPCRIAFSASSRTPRYAQIKQREVGLAVSPASSRCARLNARASPVRTQLARRYIRATVRDTRLCDHSPVTAESCRRPVSSQSADEHTYIGFANPGGSGSMPEAFPPLATGSATWRKSD